MVTGDAREESSTGTDGWVIYRIGRRFQSYLDAHVSAYGLTSAQVPLLEYLWAGNEGGTQNDMAKALSVDKGTISRNVATLVRLGLVTQSPSTADSRACVVSLTPKGTSLHGPVTRITEEWQVAIQSHFDDTAYDSMVEALSRVDQATQSILDEQRPGAA